MKASLAPEFLQILATRKPTNPSQYIYVTNANQDPKMEPDGPVVEVTPEMVDRGLRVYWDFDPEGDSPRELMRDVFLAMLSLRRG